ncbi:hypothetical protein C1645_882190 [Glomus cerebriforme]|uniref:CBM20 domain-containing protein n=1 Tax=Glomus cerebriforme TaxID=658196 RepID=A0A397S4I5_9GLOM|nr:hypothetical protein C1645_882190 [Glomus cerebriforme]
MENRKVTFHVHLPTNIEKLGNPIVIGDKEKFGEWKKPVVKLHRPYIIDHPTYWKSDTIIIPKGPIRYAYAIHVPSSLLFLEDIRILYEGDVKSRTLGHQNNIYDIWINGNNSELKKYYIDKNNILDYVFVDYIYKYITINNLKEKILEYQNLLIIHKDLTIKFSNYDFILKESLNDESTKEQQIFLCVLLGYHILRESNSFKLSSNFHSSILIKSFINYQKNFLPEVNHLLFMALLCLIQHNASQSRSEWFIIFTIVKEIDPEYSFLKNLQNIKYDEKYLEKIKPHINTIDFENKIKIIQWLIQLCQDMESLFQVWNILLVRNKQITQYFIYRVQEIILNKDTDILMNQFSKIPKEFQDHISLNFRKRILLLLKNPDRDWKDQNILSLRELFNQDNLKWNDDDIIISLELISKSHNLELLKIFPKILNDRFIKNFFDKKLEIICKNWFKLFLFKLGIKNTCSDESKYVITIFQQLDYIYPLLNQWIDIWNDLLTIAKDKMRVYSESCILGATSSIMEIKEEEVKRLFIEISKERLNETVQRVNDQLMNKIFIICDRKIDSFPETIETLDIPNMLCEDMICYIMFILKTKSTISDPSEQHLSILKSHKFWNIILNATGNVKRLKSNSYVQHIQMSIAELNRLLLEKTIDIKLLNQILEYSDEYLSQHFSMLKTFNMKAMNDIITQDEIVVLRIIINEDYANRLDQLIKFYEEFCSAPKVINVNDYIQDIQQQKFEQRRSLL